MNKVNNIISSIYRLTTAVFLFVVRTILKGIRKIIKATISLCNLLIERRLQIFFVIILPIIANYFLVTHLERGICAFELPVSSHQDDLITCGKALSDTDPLSRINPDLANLLRYDFSIKNNWYAVNEPGNTSYSNPVILIKDEEMGKERRVPTGGSDTIEKNLSHSEVVDKLKNYAPVLEIPAKTSGIMGGWELSYQPDILSVIIQFIVTLVAWFQLVKIYMFLKK